MSYVHCFRSQLLKGHGMMKQPPFQVTCTLFQVMLPLVQDITLKLRNNPPLYIICTPFQVTAIERTRHDETATFSCFFAAK